MAQIAPDTERPLDDTRLEEAPSTAATGRAPKPDNDRRDAAPTARDTNTPSVIRGSSPAQPRRIERIARRAYELYEQRGGERGQEVRDWLEAERQIDDADDDPGDGTR